MKKSKKLADLKPRKTQKVTGGRRETRLLVPRARAMRLPSTAD